MPKRQYRKKNANPNHMINCLLNMKASEISTELSNYTTLTQKEMLSSLDDKGRNLLMIAASTGDLEKLAAVFKLYYHVKDKINLMTHKCNQGFNVLMHAALSGKPTVLRAVWKLFFKIRPTEKQPKLRELREKELDHHDNTGKNILSFYHHSPEMQEEIMSLFRKSKVCRIMEVKPIAAPMLSSYYSFQERSELSDPETESDQETESDEFIKGMSRATGLKTRYDDLKEEVSNFDEDTRVKRLKL